MIDFSQTGKTIRVSAPHRIDIAGSTWDIKALVMPFEKDDVPPNSVNISLNLRTSVILDPYKMGQIRITDQHHTIDCCLKELDFSSRLGLAAAIVNYFQISGIQLQIQYEAPPHSGLGGSGVLAVCVAAVLNKAETILTDQKELSPAEIVFLAHNIEHGLFSITGLQDQTAAVFGGVHQWQWRYSGNPTIQRKTLLEPENYAQMEKRLVLAHLGQHNSTPLNEKQLAAFFSPKTRPLWLKIKGISQQCAEAIKALDWDHTAQLISQEHELRLQMVPERMLAAALPLEKAAKQLGAGFAACGAGQGCYYALCPDINQTTRLKKQWQALLEPMEPTAKFLAVKIAKEGLKYRGT